MSKKLIQVIIISVSIIILYIVIRYQSIQIQQLQSQIKEQSTRISNIKNHNEYLRKSIHTMIIEGSNRGINFRNIIERPEPINTRISKRLEIDRIPIRIEKPVIEPINKEIIIQPIFIQPTVEEPKNKRKRRRDTKKINGY